MDNDLLDVHLHADEISPAGVKALVAAMQRERDTLRATMSDILERCAQAKTEGTTIEALQDRIDEIDYYLSELDFKIEIVQPVDWRELVRHGA